jgi:Flp pilus assembly protein TadD
LLEAAAAAPAADAEAWSRLGDWYRKADRHTDAARAYGRAIAAAEAVAGAKPNWVQYFLRGSSAEQAGDWAAAEPDLRRALELAPDEPTALNYLGYALLDRGRDLDAAQALIARASALRPDDGFITDSLGWAQFRLGQFDAAVTTLERAVAAEPGDPTINEHLGDAYWRAGRRIEARFRWRSAFDLGTTPKAKAMVAAKLDYGLDIALTSAGQGDAAWLSNTRPPN